MACVFQINYAFSVRWIFITVKVPEVLNLYNFKAFLNNIYTMKGFFRTKSLKIILKNT